MASINKLLTGYEEQTSPAAVRARAASLSAVKLEHLARAALRIKARQLRGDDAVVWPKVYVNRESGKPYAPHTADEEECLLADDPPRLLVKGGEGSGKSVFGVIKTLERLRRGCTGVMGSPDLPHFRRSLWPEFRRWCPWDMVVPRQRRLQVADWEPHESFTLTFINGAQLLCGGFEDPTAWEGPNLNFAHYDEARRDKTPAMLKVLDGRIRIEGPGGIPPQLWFTTTPRKHWLYTYFGPIEIDQQGEEDDLAEFKRNARTITLRTIDNEVNMGAGYTARRSQSLSQQEIRVLMEAEWEDISDPESFISSMVLWDSLEDDTLPEYHGSEVIVLAADAGVSNDHFALVGVGWHPLRDAIVVPRIVREWIPTKGNPLDFDEIQREITAICRAARVVHFAYDPHQLHQMATSLEKGKVVKTKAFGQVAERLASDKMLLDLIVAGKLAHDGNPLLRRAIQNADRLMDADRTKLRIVKREDKLKIDLAVALSMACARLFDPKVMEDQVIGLPAGLALGAVVRG